uniref:RPA_C domain-containing protein n=1 Tax=Rhabditophanes sp. KR3021 TaxID=114890 RepID=A0AC35TUA2_9BILA
MNPTQDDKGWADSSMMDSSAITPSRGGNANSRVSNIRMHERLNIPTTVADICAIPPGSEKLSIGKYEFGKVEIVAHVVSQEDNNGIVSYMISDVKKPRPTIQLFNYNQNDEADTIADNSIIKVSAKLQIQSEQLSLILIRLELLKDGRIDKEETATVQKREDILMVQAAEARFCKLLYGKNLLEEFKSNPHQFGGIPMFCSKFLTAGGPTAKTTPYGQENTPLHAIKTDATPSSFSGSAKDQVINSMKSLKIHNDNKITLQSVASDSKLSSEVVGKIIEELVDEGMIYPLNEHTFALSF